MKKFVINNNNYQSAIKCLAALCILVLVFLPASAQQPASRKAMEAMEKMEKDAMKFMDSLQNDPAIKGMLRDADQMTMPSLDTARKSGTGKVSSILFPKRNTAAISYCLENQVCPIAVSAGPTDATIII
jgi:uncharacterized protein involved in copper resistance